MFSTNLSEYIKERMDKCNTKEDYIQIRQYLREYGIENFYRESEWFKNGRIVNTVFSNMVEHSFKSSVGPSSKSSVKIKQKYIIYHDMLLIDCPYNNTHKLLTPRTLVWNTFNVLTLDKSHIEMLKNMKRIALEYIKESNSRSDQNQAIYKLYFHCFPFNSVNTLHLHIVDIVDEPEFEQKNNNLSIDDVVFCLENGF